VRPRRGSCQVCAAGIDAEQDIPGEKPPAFKGFEAKQAMTEMATEPGVASSSKTVH